MTKRLRFEQLSNGERVAATNLPIMVYIYIYIYIYKTIPLWSPIIAFFVLVACPLALYRCAYHHVKVAWVRQYGCTLS